MNTPSIMLFSAAIAAWLLSAFQSSMEPYRREERAAAIPSKQEVKDCIADTTVEAGPQMATVLAALQSLQPKPIPRPPSSAASRTSLMPALISRAAGDGGAATAVRRATT